MQPQDPKTKKQEAGQTCRIWLFSIFMFLIVNATATIGINEEAFDIS